MDKKSIFKAIVETTKVVAPAIAAERLYHGMFGHHITSPKYLSFEHSDFSSMLHEKHSFLSYSKKRLIGYIYYSKRPQIKGIFVFSHGYGGGGHHRYLDLINVVVKQGFHVFAYDATANDESEGDDMRGFTQGMLDADKAISYVESLKQYKGVPIYLMGHSWGAYSASNALDFHKMVKGLITLSGFNQSYSIFESNGQIYAGDESKGFLSHIIDREESLFGKMAFHTAVESFEKTNAKVVIIHSGDDRTVPISAGYEVYYPLFKDNKNFKFVRFNSRGHGTVYYTIAGKKYYDKIYSGYEKYLKANKEASQEEKENYLKNSIDRKKFTHLVDEELIKDAIKFITK